ncbi:MAG: hypothetical protein IJP11_08425 [Oscillospiraceae bacterium]|nr:hypothetical protein [Oscillospiraceae bacterium]
MKKNKIRNYLVCILMPLLAIALMLCFLGGLSNLTQGHSEEDKARLEDVLRRAAVACYAAEGVYPPDLAYLESHYGVQIDRNHYIVNYSIFAENLMPDITVLEK